MTFPKLRLVLVTLTIVASEKLFCPRSVSATKCLLAAEERRPCFSSAHLRKTTAPVAMCNDSVWILNA